MPDIYAKHMTRDATEVQRMNQQYQIITEALGWTIHPSIAAKLPPSPKIADFATGTGLFLRSIAPDYPNARLDGYDLSSAMFPPESDLPSNVRLHPLDAKQTLPTELLGVYDLIHVRFLIAGMEPNEWEPVLKNLLLALKPGGAIQWIEPAMSNVQHVRGRPESTTDTMTIMSWKFRPEVLQRRFENGWSTLPGLMKQIGLTVETDIVSSDRLPDGRRPLTENGLIALFAAAKRMSRAGTPGAMSEPKIQELEEKAWGDIESGCYVRYDVHTAVGFKP